MATQYIRDGKNQLIGQVVSTNTKIVQIRDDKNRYAGQFNGTATYDDKNKFIGWGNQTGRLIKK